jgi:hypothetical protein
MENYDFCQAEICSYMSPKLRPNSFHETGILTALFRNKIFLRGVIRDRSVGHLVANLMDFFISQLPVRSSQQVDSARNIFFLLIRPSWFCKVYFLFLKYKRKSITPCFLLSSIGQDCVANIMCLCECSPPPPYAVCFLCDNFVDAVSESWVIQRA